MPEGFKLVGSNFDGFARLNPDEHSGFEIAVIFNERYSRVKYAWESSTWLWKIRSAELFEAIQEGQLVLGKDLFWYPDQPNCVLHLEDGSVTEALRYPVFFIKDMKTWTLMKLIL